MRWFLLLVAVCLLTGCKTTREITFSAIPADAELRIDGQARGRGPITQEVTFADADDVKTFSASRKGYKDQSVEVRRDDEKTAYTITLRPQSKKLTFAVGPVPAIFVIDGQKQNAEYSRQIVKELEFTVDAKDQWTTHKVRVERPNFAPAEVVVNFNDPKSTYLLNLEPLRKTLKVTSNPSGADITIGGDSLGKTPLIDEDRAFVFDVEAGAFQPITVRATKPGYDPVEKSISWDDGQTDYKIDLLAKSKTVRIVTDPANAAVEIDGTKYPVDNDGVATAKLDFPPINDKGDLKTYSVVVTKKTTDSEWHPATLPVSWDNGKQDYSVVLKEILTRPVSLTVAEPQRGDNGWTFAPKTVSTLGYKDTTEGSKKSSPQQLTRLPKGTMIDTLAAAPDGQQMLFTVLIVNTEKQDSRTEGKPPVVDFRSQMMMIKTDGTGGLTAFSDGKSLDLHPCFTPDGQQIVYSSNRAGRKLSVWQMSAVGTPGFTQLTTGETHDLWPTIDSDPRPRLFYQSFVDTRPDPRLNMTQLGTVLRTDLTTAGGSQPRVSPKADSVVFTQINERTGKRDLYLMSDKGGQPQNLTNSPDVDEFDPAWNRDGSRLAFVSDKALDDEKRRNYDVYVIDIARPEAPTQVTTNGSWDDQPQWDNTGNHLFFRSNRGGEWNIWKIAVK